MSKHSFTLILSAPTEVAPELADALFEVTGGDIEFNVRQGVAYLEFERAASSLRAAVTSAITEVEGADLGVRVVRVESEAANTIARINSELYEAITKA